MLFSINNFDHIDVVIIRPSLLKFLKITTVHICCKVAKAHHAANYQMLVATRL